ncbi:cation:proton antiporter family protein [Ornithinicoccus halotolerans]|uniref:cation:proton antiporter family protein n=1 Tax=Ornithinicoccus halotolerans TaxID=1748220 RepID=UPI0012959EC5|nr:cation:proton antiporter family protein [Ornithinicoccus halotolerans]
MASVSLLLGATLACGLLAVLLRLPPLVGFLAAGFLLHAGGVSAPPGLDVVADLGVTLLLFGIGLKLDVRSLLERHVWVTGLTHLAASIALGALLLLSLSWVGAGLLADVQTDDLALLAFALSFSSTVFVVKVLEDRSESQSLYGRTAIGILIIQDLAAVVFIAASGATLPSPWALTLLLLPLVAWLLRRVWDHTGHGEMQALFGVVAALVPGYAWFEAVGLKGDLGALVVGVLLASHASANELSRTLFTVKELLLVGFFVSIGMTGLPPAPDLLVALLLLLVVPVKAGGYVLLLSLMRLRHRTSVLAGLALANYSEFGLIVAVVGSSTGIIGEQWVAVLSVAVAASFVLSALVNRRGTGLVRRIAARLPAQDPQRLHPEDRPIDIGRAHAVVLGMGRVGRAVHRTLTEDYGMTVLGIDSNRTRVARLREEGMDVVEGDATDAEFWERISRAGRVRLVVLAMPFHGANLLAVDRLTASEFNGTVAAVAQYDDEMAEITARGADAVFQIYAGAGTALAESAAEAAGYRRGQGAGPRAADR